MFRVIKEILASKLVTRTAVVFFVMWCVGQLVRDQYWITGLMFFIASGPALVGLLSIGVFNLAIQRHALGIAFLACAVLPAFVVVQVDNQLFRSSDSEADGELKLLHWNAFEGNIHWEGGEGMLLNERADIYVLSEPPHASRIERFMEQLHGDYSVETHGTISVIARGQVGNLEELVFTEDVEAFSVQWAVNGTVLKLLCIDLASDIFLARSPMLSQVNQLIREHDPDLVVGDFNAPRRSLLLQQLPDRYEHAYDICGSGLSYTWPAPLPCFTIDQCIVGPRIMPRSFGLITTWSDHRAQRLVFDIAP